MKLNNVWSVRHNAVVPCFVRVCAVLFALGCSTTFVSGQTINNGGFESGLSSWTVSGSFYFFNNAARAHSGSQYSYFGRMADGTTTLNNGSGNIYQTVSIPTGATTATLSFWLWVASDEPASPAYDHLYAEVLSNAGSLLATLADYSNADKSGPANSSTPAYSQKSFSLLAYAGKPFEFGFVERRMSPQRRFFGSTMWPSVQWREPLSRRCLLLR